jgi:hypothetical protein
MKLPVQMPVDAVPQPDLPRILSTVLFGLATLESTGIHGLAQLFRAMLAGLAAVWLLWRPASSASFRRCRQAALPRQP